MALIEQPTNKDAIELMIRATETLQRQRQEAQYKQFIEDAKAVCDLLTAMGTRLGASADNLSTEMATNQLPAVEQLKQRAQKIF